MKPPERPRGSRAAWGAGLAILAIAILKFGYDFTRPGRDTALPDADTMQPSTRTPTALKGRPANAGTATPEVPAIKVQPDADKACPFVLVGVVRLDGPPPRPQAVLRHEPTAKLCRVTIGDTLPGEFRLADVADDRVVIADAKGRLHVLILRLAPRYGH